LEEILDMQHIFVARGENVVLHDVSLKLHAGEHLAILGPNGCGKSTLLKAATSEIYPIAKPETKVRIFGRERWDLTQLKRRMGVVSAELPGRATLATKGFDAILTGFFSSSTLWPNLAVTPAMRQHAEEIVTLVGAEALREKPVGEMSAGQQRRVMIGRAIAGTTVEGDAKMLLLDEPSNALDLAAQRDLREMLRRLAQRGVAIVLITHHIADILPEMKRVVMMREGRIVADGAKDALLTEQRLSALFGGEIRVDQRDGWTHAW
jgi:iron complex transport system ATP-binding protein